MALSFTVEVSEFLKALKGAAKALPSRTTLPILQNMLFKLDGDELEIAATNLDFSVIEKVLVSEPEGEGSFTVPGKTILNIISNMTEPFISIENEGFTTILKTPKGNKYELMGLDPQDFPKITHPEGGDVFEFDTETIMKGVNLVSFCAAKDDLRAFLTGIYWHVTEEFEMRFVASDSHRLAVYGKVGEFPSGFEAIVPPKVFDFIKEHETEKITVQSTKELLEFRTPYASLITRLIEGPYPNYEAVIPDLPGNGVLRVNRDELLTALKRLLVFTTSPTYTTIWHFKEREIIGKASSPEAGEGMERLLAEYEGQEMTVGFNAEYLAEIVRKIESFEVEMHLYDPYKAVYIKPTDSTKDEKIFYLLMPVRIAESEFGESGESSEEEH
ncbi:MAG: DNA polymerase III subunit beta [Candidatus Hydrothermota bacterium]|nr:MAG: DNA polymerase III subunit beta [Candidatus Hydrothermae bacterium]